MNLKAHMPLALSAASCAFAGLLLVGCHSGANQSATSTTGASGTATNTGGATNLAFVTNNPSDYWTICRKGVEAAEKALPGVKVQFVMPQDGTAATQKTDCNDLIAKGVQGIAISPVDPDNQTDFLNQVAAKIPLITSDSDAPKSKRLCYIGTDNHAAGVLEGNLIKQAIPQGGKIVMFVGQADAQNAKDRMQGVRDALKSDPRYNILDVRTDGADHAMAQSNAETELVKVPDVACLVGIWSYNGPAISRAVQAAGKVGKVKVVCFDSDPGTPEGIKSGVIFGTVVQQPYEFGYKSVEMLDKLAHGDKSTLPANGLMIIPNEVIKADNLDKYLADQKKLMGA